MNTKKLITIGSISATFLFTACNEKTDTSVVEESKEALSEMKESSTDAWADLTDYSVEKKEQAVAFMQEQSVKLDAKIDSLQESTAEGKQEALQGLTEIRAEMNDKIESLKHATEESWDDAVDEAEETWTRFVEYLENADDKSAA